MITLLLNPDEYMAAERMAEFKAALGDPEMADLNTAEIDGPRTSASDILGQASMMPFLAPMRLLIVSGYLSHLDKRMGQSKGTDNAAYAEATSVLAGLIALPDTCHLIFLENAVDKRRHLWKGFKPDGGGAKVAGLADLVKTKTVALEELNTPDAGAVEGWLMRRAKQKKIAIDGQAIKMLSTFVGPNLRQLDNELEKLATYASGRAVSAGDVRLAGQRRQRGPDLGHDRRPQPPGRAQGHAGALRTAQGGRQRLLSPHHDRPAISGDLAGEGGGAQPGQQRNRHRPEAGHPPLPGQESIGPKPILQL